MSESPSMRDPGRGRSVVSLQRRGRPAGAGPHAVDQALEEIGCDLSLVPQESFDPRSDGVVFAYGSANWYSDAWRRMLATSPAMRPPVILWHAEPLPYARSTGRRLERPHLREVAKIVLRDARASDPWTNYRRLRGLLGQGLPDLLVVSTLEKQEFLAEQGIESAVVPLGYHRSHGRDLALDRDIDVLFLGALDVPRRKRILRNLRQAGIEAQAAGDWDDPAYWGENRTRLLNRTKILLNLPRHPGLLSGARMIIGMANGALVIAEPIHLSAPYVDGTHFVSAALEDMPEVIRHYLANDAERERIATEGQRFVTGELTMANSLRRILALLDEHNEHERD
jgi:hypothetical protein